MNQQSQGSETYAVHQSPGYGMVKSQGQSDIMSSQGTYGNINSPYTKQGMKGQSGQNQYGLGVNGQGLHRDDSFQQIEQHHQQMQQQSYGHQPKQGGFKQGGMMMKVINYNEDA